MKILLVFIPISIICKIVGLSPTVLFFLSILSILPLAALMGEGTEEISHYTGPKVGGFLNATLGNSVELIISFFALRAGLFDVVKASIIGSLLGNVLLVLGASMFFGGLKYKTQKVNKNIADLSANMLLFAAIGMTIPAIFTHTSGVNEVKDNMGLSLFVAVVMFAIYIASLFFSFYTHKDIYSVQHEEIKPKWSLLKAVCVLIIATTFIAYESELLVETVEPMTNALNLSKIFVGIIIIPIVGNAAEHSVAVIMAMKNKMDIAIEIAVGSSLQIVLFVMPMLVFISLLYKPMDIIFNKFELVTLIVSVLIVNKVADDGETNWLEGIQLVSVYLIIAACFMVV